nr:rhodanese-like domain-containing protein [uncultured Kingella sp.]
MKKLLNLALIAAAIATPLASQAAPAKKAAAHAKTAAQQPARAKGVWIDVRTPEEFNEGHLQGAVNVPHDQIASQIARISPDKKAPVNLYCRSGRRAEAALQELKKMGYTNVTNHGGYQDLINKGIQ